MIVACAVCELEMEPDDAVGTVVIDETRYYFCSDKCREEFQENPELFAEAWDDEEP